jgi:hypothetical protein
VCFDFDWNILYESHDLRLYDIYIFDKSQIKLQTFNDPDFDGTQFIGKFPGMYLLRLKKYRNTPIILQEYDIYYFIFKHCFDYFIHSHSIDRTKCFVHLYPGGGNSNLNISEQLAKAQNSYGVKFIITDGAIYDRLKTCFPESKMIYTPCATLCIENEPLIHKSYQPNDPLGICFSSMGDPESKGFYIYEKIITNYLQLYPKHKINFYACGNCHKYSNNKNIIFKNLMPQNELDNFYNKDVDIYINLNQSNQLQGFPLGGESLLQGCVLLTTDMSKQNGKYLTLNESDGVFIVEPNQINKIISIIHDLYENRNKCHQLGIKAQFFSHDIFGYTNQQAKIFKFIESNL